MASDKIIYYDREFIKKFEELKALLETGDRQQIYQFLLKEFQFIFKLNQYYWKQIAESNAREFLEEEEEIRQELMRPLSHRQYRMIERSFSRWLEEEDHVIWSIWDFLHDNDRIYQKKVMSSAEVGGCSMILENVYSCLARKTVKDK
jgi:prephenate dehydrogenase